MARYTREDVYRMSCLVRAAILGSSQVEAMDSDKRVNAGNHVMSAVERGTSLGYGSRYILKDKAVTYLAGKGSRYSIAFLYGMAKATDGIEKLGTTFQAEEIEILMNGVFAGGSGISEEEFDGMADRGMKYMNRFIRKV